MEVHGKMFKRLSLILMVVLLFPAVINAFPQNANKAKEPDKRVSNTTVVTQGARLMVTYDLAGTGFAEVSVVFKDGEGKIYETSDEALSGDVGENVEPGKGKKIIWRFLKDFPYGISPGELSVHVTASVPGEVEKEENTEAIKTEGTVKISIETNMGTIIAELDADKAPLSVGNFVQYANDGHYDGTIFHRVIDGFMIQGGGFTAEMSQKDTNAPVKNEADNGLTNDRGTLAMARTSVVDSATSQFFINLVDNGFLNHKNTSSAGYGYAVFGKVVEGMDVVDAIGKVQTGNSMGFQDVPVETVVLEKVSVVD
jgi:cyclophilin family peptidyl-prolyl cis-trans isomerase